MENETSITIAFYHGHNVMSWITRIFQWKVGKQRFSEVPFHVCLVIDNVVTESVRSGVRQREWLSNPEDAFAKTFTVSVENIEEIKLWLTAQIGKPYDYLAAAFDMMGIVDPLWLKLPVQTEKRWNCSRIVAQALKRGRFFLPYMDNAISPDNILMYLAYLESHKEKKIDK